MRGTENRRILLIDDTPAIHQDFRKILVPREAGCQLEELEQALFGAHSSSCCASRPFLLDSAYQGEEGLARLVEALEEQRPYAVAFVDMRMPPGWDGVETIERLWAADPRLQVVICTAHADYSWEETMERLGVGDRLLILKKPFDAVEVCQLADALSAKWNLSRLAELKTTQLEKLVQLRTCQLESLNFELARARDEAQAASRVKSEFLANMSHEIRTPMNATLGMIHLALLSGLDPSQQLFVAKAKGAAESLMGLLDDILDYSKLESGKLKLQQREFLLQEELERLTPLMAEKAQLKQLEFLVDAAPHCFQPLIGDPNRLGQVLFNLCDNAVKFSDRGTVLLRVRATGEAPGSLTLRFSVSDTGIGIDPANLEKLFRPFSQLDSSSTRKNGGAGMGLAITKELVELMGGELKVVSGPGQGSEFFFSASFGKGRQGDEAHRGAAKGGAVDPSADPPGLPELPGISVANGLRYCCDNMEFYQGLLLKFLERSHCSAEIKEALAKGERVAAAREAHTMTSVAGTIGAGELSEAARELQRGIESGAPEALAPLLERFDRQLAQVIASLTAHFGEPDCAGRPVEARPLNPGAVRELLDRMSALFDRDLDRALALKDLLKTELRGTILAQEFGQMERQIERFDFDGALQSRERIDKLLEMASAR